ncbi:MAG: hypothetical protein GXY87_06490 [Tissierellia bacterium]|nr:hypothetical protein [Tissierellia bacterium]
MKKSIYVIISRTNTKMGTFIRTVTQYDYNHVSLSLKETLTPMYSFARYHQDKPFTGGFVEESWLRYLQKDRDIELIIFDIEVDEKIYQHSIELMDEYIANKDNHRYNFAEAIKSYFPLYQSGEGTNHTCLSFVVAVLQELEVIDRDKTIKSIKRLYDELLGYDHIKRVITREERKNYIINHEWNNDEYLLKSKRYIRDLIPLIKKKK